jgi:hypothetical protein
MAKVIVPWHRYIDALEPQKSFAGRRADKGHSPDGISVGFTLASDRYHCYHIYTLHPPSITFSMRALFRD